MQMHNRKLGVLLNVVEFAQDGMGKVVKLVHYF